MQITHSNDCPYRAGHDCEYGASEHRAKHGKTIIGQTAIDAEKDATIARLTAELEAARAEIRKETLTSEGLYERLSVVTQEKRGAEAERDALVVRLDEIREVATETKQHTDKEARGWIEVHARNALCDVGQWPATAAYTAAIRAAEVRGMREAAGICAAAVLWRASQLADNPEEYGETQINRWSGGKRQAELLEKTILAAATAKEDARE